MDSNKDNLVNTFIISDTFFGRRNIIKLYNRPFNNVDEMNNMMVGNWNSVVGENDVVYHLGNFAWDPRTAIDILELLNGKIIFILGEYDDALLEVVEYFSDKIEILDRDIYKDYKNRVILSHYPLESWPGKERGIYHFHGHDIKLDTDLSKMRRINICADRWNFTPQNIKSLLEIFREFEGEVKGGAKSENEIKE